jgi:P-type Cu+ transporter
MSPAFAYNTCLIPIAGEALVPFWGAGVYSWLPFMAVGAMTLSSVTVVGNSLLLDGYKPKFAVIKPKSEQIYTEKKLEEEVYIEATT